MATHSSVCLENPRDGGAWQVQAVRARQEWSSRGSLADPAAETATAEQLSALTAATEPVLYKRFTV